MRNDFAAVVEQDGGRFITYSPDIPGANGLSERHDRSGPVPAANQLI
jgi:hypothetical protein